MKPDPSMMVNGMLAGLVAITAPCAFVDPWAAVVIGAIAGVLVVMQRRSSSTTVASTIRSAPISVHGVNGLWGVLSVGIFANGKYGAGWNGVVRDEFVKKYGSDGVRGILYGDASQLVDADDRLRRVSSCSASRWRYVWFKVSNLITPIRVSAEVEIEGLDGPEMGSIGYPDFALAGGRPTSTTAAAAE